MFDVKYCTFGHHSEVHHLGDGSLIGGKGESSAEEAAVHSWIVKGHIMDVDGGVLQVSGPFTTIPVHTVPETVINYSGRLTIIGIDLCKQQHLHVKGLF